MIYVLEVPHQFPPAVWADQTADGIIGRVSATMLQRRSGDGLPETFEDAVAWIGHDAHDHRVFMTDEEALRAYIEEDVPGHQAGRSLTALRKALQYADVLDEDGIDQPARDLALKLWQEQIAAGIGQPGEVVDPDELGEWLANRTYSLSRLLEAAHGQVDALAEVREEAGLPVLK